MKLDHNYPRYPSIGERDINLLLVEETLCQGQFQQSLLSHCDVPLHSNDWTPSVMAWTEVCLPGEHAAEIDILIQADASVTACGKSIQLLIENKIDVDFQPYQPERYRTQAETVVRSGEVDIAKTVILAPEGYIKSNSMRTALFDIQISYEQLRQWILQSNSYEDSRRRAEAKAILIEQGIRKQKRLMPQIISPAVTLTWNEIYKIAESEYPDLRMPPPGDKGRSSWSIDLPCIDRGYPFEKVRLEYVLKKGDHVIKPGTVTILIPGVSDSLDQAISVLGKKLEAGMELRNAGKSLGVSVSVPPVEPGKPLMPQIESLRVGFTQAQRLKRWIETNRSALATLLSNLPK